MRQPLSRIGILLREAIDAVQLTGHSGEGDRFPGHSAIAGALTQMLSSLEEGHIILTDCHSHARLIGHIISDSWPLASPLGEKILGAAGAYEHAATQSADG